MTRELRIYQGFQHREKFEHMSVIYRWYTKLTKKSYFIDCLQKVLDVFLRINSIGYTLARMTQNNFTAVFIDAGPVHQSGAGVFCIMRKVLHAQPFHNRRPYIFNKIFSAISVSVGLREKILPLLCHKDLHIRINFVGKRNRPIFTGFRFYSTCHIFFIHKYAIFFHN